MGWLHLGCGGMVRCHHVRVAQRGPAERRSLGMEAFELVTAHVWEAVPSGQIWGVRGGRDGHLVHGRLVKSLVGGTVAYRVKDVLSVGWRPSIIVADRVLHGDGHRAGRGYHLFPCRGSGKGRRGQIIKGSLVRTNQR